MKKVVLDNSVVVKWFASESDSEQARQYLYDFLAGKFTIVVPTLLFYELGNVFISKRLSVVEISDFMKQLQTFSFQIEDVGLSLFRKVFQNAQEYGLTFYDASYVTLMQKYNCELVTADKKLYQKLHKTFTSIKLLKS